MVFTSVPLFLDPPNWHQQQSNNGETQISQQITAGGGGPTRAATSMTERARQAKIPMPEVPLKCPRCDSQNTKFCYFNNYNLSQPRHFCKTCRRYWTRGGSLRNVPVGGGCRRNKRKRSSKRQKSPAAASVIAQTEPPATQVPEQFVAAPPPPQFSFMASLQSLMTSQLGIGNNYGSAFGSSSMYPFQNNSNNYSIGGETTSYGKGLNLMEELRGGELNLMSKQYNGSSSTATDDVGVMWSSNSNGGLWTDFSGICSSSTSTTPMNNGLR